MKHVDPLVTVTDSNSLQAMSLVTVTDFNSLWAMLLIIVTDSNSPQAMLLVMVTDSTSLQAMLLVTVTVYPQVPWNMQIRKHHWALLPLTVTAYLQV